MSPIHAELADRFFRAIEQNDASALSVILSDDFRIWQNFSGMVKSKAEAIADITERRSAALFKFRTLQRLVAPEGVADQVEATIDIGDGQQLFTTKIAVIFTIKDHRITAIDEYFDIRDTNKILESLKTDHRGSPVE